MDISFLELTTTTLLSAPIITYRSVLVVEQRTIKLVWGRNCGIYNNPSDKIVALNSAQFGGGYPGPNCFKGITICKGSNCHYAQITDECPTCDYGSLDLSQSLFEQFASTDDGIFQMTWTFNDDKPETTEKPDPPKTTKKPDPPETTEKPDPPKTTKKPEPEPEPTTTSERPTTTSKPKPKTTSTPEPTTSTSTSTSAEPTTTSTSEAKSSVTSTSQNPTSAVETSAALSTTTASVGAGSGASSGASGGSNWADMNQVMLAMGRLATVAQEHN
ncbi:hypothetical protein FRC07_009311 [Ceratobasidium sp. 392]|nr:hypothetical protein FRC07_009311 [Ceratobasidium sp. 392]